MLAQNMATTDYKARLYQAELGLRFEPSLYQVELFDWVKDGEGHAVVEAVAGSGKTSSIVATASLLSGRAVSVAFNKPVAVKLSEELPHGVESSTAHALGRRLIVDACPGLYVKVVAGKYRSMLRDARDAAKSKGSLCGQPLTAEQRRAIAEDGFPVGECERLLNLARLALLDMDADDFDAQLRDLADRHDLVESDACIWPLIVTAVQNCMWLGCELPEQVRGRSRAALEIDYTDMLWLPVVHGFRPRRSYDWMLVDECQDISTAARRMLMSCMGPSGRMIWVGDRRQAVYGFAGADAESFAAIVEECKATVLPLSVCYRCPTSHLDLAREWCPQIEAREGAPVGEITKLPGRADYIRTAKSGDLVVCRRNAPLLSLCFELIASGIPAIVRGRAIADGLCLIVDKVSQLMTKRAADFAGLGSAWSDRFARGLDLYHRARAEEIVKRYKDEDRAAEAVEQLADKVECVRVIWARSGASSAESLCSAIEELFSDDRGTVTLSSVHRAKGLEAERVGILEPDRLQSTWAKRAWQVEQEENIAYVAFTRSKRELILIPGDR